MAAPAKFLFDTDFAAPDKSRREAATAAEVAQKVAAAEQRAYRDGFDAGPARGQGRERPPRGAGAGGDRDRRAGHRGRALPASRRGWRPRRSRSRSPSRESSAAELIAAEPLGEIAALVGDCFSHLVSTPHLVVRINDALYEVDARAASSGSPSSPASRAGSSSSPSPRSRSGDCRIEWADGGVVLERAAIDAKIDELVGRYIASRNEAAPAAMGS